MGNGVIIRCNNCHFSQEFLLGKGAYLPQLEEILKTSDKKCIRIVKQINEEYPIERYTVVRQLFYCSDCKNIIDKSILKVEFSEGISYEEEMFCSNCGSKLKKVIDYNEIKDIACPVCGLEALTYINNYSSWE
ncbi:hypothetical protein [Clostridium paridis]|uniref:hypothetical protein n=1 Tax=Clostridium paridis TaxID=2803863 RepID=UPI00192B3BCF|nr:hypothetical protein [Clostridium paridis]